MINTEDFYPDPDFFQSDWDFDDYEYDLVCCPFCFGGITPFDSICDVCNGDGEVFRYRVINELKQ